MSIITLTTDFGTKDHFVASVKGAILSQNIEARIVDISHQISPFNHLETAYILKNAYKSFPKGTIHIIGVDSEHSPVNRHLAAKIDGQYFICADNGILSFLTTDLKVEQIVEINIHDRIESSFPLLDIFVHVAMHIERGGQLGVVGKEISQIKTLNIRKALFNEEANSIIAHIIYNDNYGNAVTNLSQSEFDQFAQGRGFKIRVGGHKFNKIHKNYSDVMDFSNFKDYKIYEGKGICLFNSSQLLEIALFRSNVNTFGGASTLLGLKTNATITITFN
ncbi:MAG: SAM hydrolase/SAM-dependent halogenase family protein [Flavobacteriaceae bacterium]